MAQPSTRRHDLDRMLGACDPALPGRLTTEGIDGALDEIGAAITGLPRGQRRAKRRRWLAAPRGFLLAGAILALIAAGAAATKLLTADTGQYAKGWEIKAGGPGQFLRTSAPDFCRVALNLSSDIAYPPGYADWRSWVLVAEEGLKRVTPTGPCGPNTQTSNGEVSSGALRGFFAMSAFCAWVYNWRQGKLDGDTGSAARAARVIASAPDWKAVLAEDPHPSASPPYIGPGQHGRMTIFGWFLPFRSAVLNGDVSLVSQLISSNYGPAGCPYFKPPAASHGGTELPARSSS
jgi:hypothetical protein